MGDIQPGDVVVCINDNPCPVFGPRLVKNGRLYRVLKMKRAACRRTGHVGTGLWLDRDMDNARWENVICFRKIRPADEQFTQSIRAKNPVREDA